VSGQSQTRIGRRHRGPEQAYQKVLVARVDHPAQCNRRTAAIKARQFPA
jgi:hypothetical protein